MENAVDAMKMAGAAMLFILAFSITMIMFGKCRATADTVMDHLQINLFMQGINGNENNTSGLLLHHLDSCCLGTVERTVHVDLDDLVKLSN